MKGVLFSSWLPNTRAGVLVFDGRRARLAVSVSEPEGSATATSKINDPQELRDLALKCMAAAEVMENAQSDAP